MRDARRGERKTHKYPASNARPTNTPGAYIRHSCRLPIQLVPRVYESRALLGRRTYLIFELVCSGR